jgi:hypothetical protein
MNCPHTFAQHPRQWGRNKIFDYIDLVIRDVKIKKAHAA